MISFSVNFTNQLCLVLTWAGLSIFLYSFQLNATVAYLGLGLTVLLFLARPEQWGGLMGHDKLFWLWLLLIMVIVTSAASFSIIFPESGSDQWQSIKDWLNVLAFLPFGWQVYVLRRRFMWMLVLMLLGIFTRILMHIDWGAMEYILEWPRQGFGLNPIVAGSIQGLAFTGLLVLGPKAFSGISIKLVSWAWVWYLCWCAGLCMLVESIILTQTRAVWMALFFCIPVSLVLQYRQAVRIQADRIQMLLVCVALFMCLVIIALNLTIITQRAHEESAVVEGIPLVLSEGKSTTAGRGASPDNGETSTDDSSPIRQQPASDLAARANSAKPRWQIHQFPETSIGFRLMMWDIGFQAWLERPLWGWGVGGTEYVLKIADFPPLIVQGDPVFSHLHSAYIEMMVRFGVMGSLIFLVWFLLLMQSLSGACQYGLISPEKTCFLIVGWLYFLLVAVFDFPIFKYAWRNYALIWLALSYAVHLEYLDHRTRKTVAISESPT